MGGLRHKGSCAERWWDFCAQLCLLLPPTESGPGPGFLGDPPPCCREPWDFVGRGTCVREKREAQHKLTPWLGCPLHHMGGGPSQVLEGGHGWWVGLAFNTWLFASKGWGQCSVFPGRQGTPLGNFPVLPCDLGPEHSTEGSVLSLVEAAYRTGIWVATSFVFLSDLSSKAIECVTKQDPTTKLSSPH